MVLVAFGQFSGQRVEAHHIAQHEQEAGLEQVAALGKHGVEVCAVPLQSALAVFVRHLHRKRHVGLHGCHIQLFKQRDQPWIGAFVVDQKTSVYAVCLHARRCGQGHVHRVGVTTEIVARFKQSDLGLAVQVVSG